MNIIKAFEKAFAQKERLGWDKIYVLVDVHDTIMSGVHKKDEPYLWYDMALVGLKMLSSRDDICLIMWTGSHDTRIRQTLAELEKRGIHFDYVNENPETEDNDFYCSTSKIYFNVGIDDRFGFEAEKDWADIVRFLTNSK